MICDENIIDDLWWNTSFMIFGDFSNYWWKALKNNPKIALLEKKNMWSKWGLLRIPFPSHQVHILATWKGKECKITNNTITPFMSFGKMPLANGFLNKNEFKSEFFFNKQSIKRVTNW